MGIYNSLPIVARALSSKLGVNVSVGGSDAYAYQLNGQFNINIPFFKDAESLSDVLLGYLVHEAAHVRFSEFKLYEQALEARLKSGNYNREVLHHLVNITEDLRIERAIARRFPGTPIYLKALNSFVFKEDSEPSDVAASVFLNAMVLCGFKRYHGLSIPTEQAQYDFIRLFGQQMFDQAMDILGLAINAPSMIACLDVSCKLYDLAVDAFNEKNDQPSDNDDSASQDESNSPDSSGSGTEQRSDSDTVEQPSDNDDSASQDESRSSDSSGSGTEQRSDSDTVEQPSGNDGSASQDESRSSDSSGSGTEQRSDSDTVDQPSDGTIDTKPGDKICQSRRYDPFADTTDDDLKEIVKGIGEQLNDALKDNIPASQRIPASVPYTIAPAKSWHTTNTATSRGVQFASGLRQSLHGLLQGMQNVRRTHRDTGRILDSRLITSALLGNTKLFKHKSKAIEFNSAFTILLDSSGSLQHNIVEAEAAVVSLLYALDGIKGVSTSAYHFPHSSANSIGLLKSRNQNLRSAINANHFGLSANGSTPLDQSLWPAFSDLLSANANRHVMIIVTDGAPDDRQSVSQMIIDAKNDGIIVIGIGFGSANQTIMSEIFGDTGIAVGTVSALREKLITVVRKILTR